MHEFLFDEHSARLFEMGGGFIAIDRNNVNIEDLIDLRPGGVVRCDKNPNECIKVVYGTNEPVGCVAGWISEDE